MIVAAPKHKVVPPNHILVLVLYVVSSPHSSEASSPSACVGVIVMADLVVWSGTAAGIGWVTTEMKIAKSWCAKNCV